MKKSFLDSTTTFGMCSSRPFGKINDYHPTTLQYPVVHNVQVAPTSLGNGEGQRREGQ